MIERVLLLAALPTLLFSALACGEAVEVGSNPGIAPPDDPMMPDEDPMEGNNMPDDMEEMDPEPGVCVEAFVDEDLDGFGVSESSCELDLEGFATQGGDCGPGDPIRHPGAEGICGDSVDDDCDGADEDCPTSQPSITAPDWDCTGEPPSNVVAWARFDEGGGFFQDGGCFIFFEGLEGEFYTARRIERANTDPSCESRNGCTCPSLNGWPAYDRRMYAFTLLGGVEECPQISIRDHGGEDQVVSNACRKYLYQMHAYDIPFSFVAHGLDVLQRRLALFPRVEIACVEDAPHRNLPFQSLLTAPIETNPGFVAR